MPIVSGVLLVWWPFLAFYDGVGAFLAGLFDPVKPEAIVLVTAVALLNAWTVLIITCLVVTYGHARMGLPKRRCIVPPNLKWWVASCAGSAVLAAPLIWRLYSRVAATEEVTSASASGFVAIGVAAAAGFFIVAAIVQWVISNPPAIASAIAPYTLLPRIVSAFISLLRKFPALGEGFLDPKDPTKLAAGHSMAFGLSVASVVAYAVTGFVTSDIHSPTYASALAYLLLLQLMMTWLLGAAAFVLDRSRAPLLVFAAIFMAGVNWLIHPYWSTDHIYRTLDQEASLQSVAVPELFGREPVSIVVAASGGGIRSATWTAQVLTGLDRGVPGFRERVRLISSVSGGSVGVMNVLASWPDCGPPLLAGEKDGFDAVAASRESSLHAVGWGLVFKDLPRTVFPFTSSPLVDRGSVLEDAWKREPRLQRRAAVGPLLGGWRRNVAEKKCPGVVYNAMVAQTGEPMLFATVDLPPSLHPFDFYAHYPTRDVPVTTAARLSAGFPFVSPASRADQDADADTAGYSHVVDGGYFDNYGINTLLGVVQHGLSSVRDASPRRLLIIEICDSQVCSGQEANGHINQGGLDDKAWTYQLRAPLDAVVAMRTAAQRVNNRGALRLMKDFWYGSSTCVESIQVPLKSSDTTPMSWHLTGAEKQTIADDWDKGEAARVIADVRAFLEEGRATDEGRRQCRAS
ncbi:MAG TPA: hypothetical protein VNT81_00540 [Vicinamibacterales bacterium]|nr:hypothetical protein [Vicinamibacterales bacterium]